MIFNLLITKIKKHYIINLLQKAQDKGILRRKKIAMILSLVETGDLICKICGQHIDNNKKASCDHIIPVSKGGSIWDVKNYQLAHRKCNSSKGNKIL
jgi:5-methylcytosine-specific restriction endonuclease McrA